MPVLLQMKLSWEICPLSRLFVTLNVWLRSLDSSFGICGAQYGAGQVVFPTLMSSSVHNYSTSALHSFFCHPGNDQWVHLGYIWTNFKSISGIRESHKCDDGRVKCFACLHGLLSVYIYIFQSLSVSFFT